MNPRQSDPTPTRGRRYSAAEKAEILADAKGMPVADAARKHNCSKWTIYNWLKKERRAQKRQTTAEELPPSVKQTYDDRHALILELWRQQPGLGPSQIRSLLKRRGFKASVHTVRAVMEQEGYVPPKLRRKEHAGRYEAIRPLQLLHLDFVHLFVHRQRQCLLLTLDDFSRFVTAFALLQSEHAGGAITALEESIARYGKPEAVMTDRGSAFHSWKGLSRFERLLQELCIDHYLAREAAVNGKCEALNASIQKELFTQVEFLDLADAHRHISRWVHFYNYRRPHHALGGVLVPADRFHGWGEETLRRVEEGQAADIPDLWNPEGRALEILKLVSTGGQPAVYVLGRKVLG